MFLGLMSRWMTPRACALDGRHAALPELARDAVAVSESGG
jgi:hypothetical protein